MRKHFRIIFSHFRQHRFHTFAFQHISPTQYLTLQRGSSRRLQLNASKTELIWFGTQHSLKKVSGDDLMLQIDSGVIHPVSVVCVLEVILYNELTMKQHLTKVASCCFYHLRRLKQIRWLVGKDVTAQLISAFILSRLDYCNALLAGPPRTTIEPLRVKKRSSLSGAWSSSTGPCDTCYEATPLVTSCKQDQVGLMHQIHIGRAPQYLVDSGQSVSSGSRRCLRSTDTAKYIKRTTRTKFGECGFSYAGPAAWHCLPPHLQAISETSVLNTT